MDILKLESQKRELESKIAYLIQEFEKKTHYSIISISDEFTPWHVVGGGQECNWHRIKLEVKL